MTLENKVIIVTGATAGIGLEIVKECLHLGAFVMIHASPNSMPKAEELVKEFGGKTACVCADLSKFEELENIVTQTIKRFGKIDSLVNNAGVFPRNNVL